MAKLASLSSGLLARKGHARPAMRPQGFGGYHAGADDLGWNDMGGPAPARAAELPPVLVEREALAVQVSAAPEAASVPDAVSVPEAASVPEATPAPASQPAPEPERVAKSVSVATATRIRRETDLVHKKGAKSAFTLRLDGERHLKLRLASAIADTSAQTLMIEALDAFLDTMPEVDALVAALPPAKRR